MATFPSAAMQSPSQLRSFALALVILACHQLRAVAEDALSCAVYGYSYEPLNMPGERRTTETSWQNCQRRCADALGCGHFSFWPDGGCHLQSPAAVRTTAQGKFAGLVVSGPPRCDNTQEPYIAPATPAAAPPPPHSDKCPGSLSMPGFGNVAIVPTGWLDKSSSPTEVLQDGSVIPHMGARAYFAETCTGTYNHTQYLGLNLLGKRMSFMADLTGAGCGCNAAFYLVSMKQNPNPSECHDYYCDANNVCGQSCTEVDIMEANVHAFHATLHSKFDHGGKGGGFGGGASWNGPRDFGSGEYGPGARCVDTNLPFQVDVTFPLDGRGWLKGMEVTLSQHGKNCPLHIWVGDYGGMAEIAKALQAGMTPVFSYWSSNNMLWMDGVGADHRGPCWNDDVSKCGAKVRMFDFSVTDIDAPAPKPAAPPATPPASPPAAALVVPPSTPQAAPELRPLDTAVAQPEVHPEPLTTPAPTTTTPLPTTTTPAPTTTTEAPKCVITRKEDCTRSHCCLDPGMQCYEKHGSWAACQISCTPGIDMRDRPDQRTPWSCRPLGQRTPGEPIVTTTTTVEPEAPEDGIAEVAGALHAETDVAEVAARVAPAVGGVEMVKVGKDNPIEEVSEVEPPKICARTRKQDCRESKCCADPGMRCYEKDEFWGACQFECTPGIDMRDYPSQRTPWTCRPLGPRTPGEPLTTTTTPGEPLTTTITMMQTTKTPVPTTSATTTAETPREPLPQQPMVIMPAAPAAPTTPATRRPPTEAEEWSGLVTPMPFRPAPPPPPVAKPAAEEAPVPPPARANSWWGPTSKVAEAPWWAPVPAMPPQGPEFEDGLPGFVLKDDIIPELRGQATEAQARRRGGLSAGALVAHWSLAVVAPWALALTLALGAVATLAWRRGGVRADHRRRNDGAFIRVSVEEFAAEC